MSAQSGYIKISGVTTLGIHVNGSVPANDLIRLNDLLKPFGWVASPLANSLRSSPKANKVIVNGWVMEHVVRYLHLEDFTDEPEETLTRNPILIALIKKILQESSLTTLERGKAGRDFGRRLREMFADCQTIEEVKRRIDEVISGAAVSCSARQLEMLAEVLLKVAEQNRQWLTTRGIRFATRLYGGQEDDLPDFHGVSVLT